MQLFSLVKENKYRWGGWVGLQHVKDSTQKTSEEWRKNRRDKRGWISTQTSAREAGNMILPAEKLRLSSIVTPRFTQPERSCNSLQISKRKTALMRFSLGVIATKPTKYRARYRVF